MLRILEEYCVAVYSFSPVSYCVVFLSKQKHWVDLHVSGDIIRDTVPVFD
jgi:hypothetical protein